MLLVQVYHLPNSSHWRIEQWAWFQAWQPIWNQGCLNWTVLQVITNIINNNNNIINSSNPITKSHLKLERILHRGKWSSDLLQLMESNHHLWYHWQFQELIAQCHLFLMVSLVFLLLIDSFSLFSDVYCTLKTFISPLKNATANIAD